MDILSPYRDEGPSVKQYIDQKINKMEKEELLELVRKKMTTYKLKKIGHKKNTSEYVQEFRESNYEQFHHTKVPINTFIKHNNSERKKTQL